MAKKKTLYPQIDKKEVNRLMSQYNITETHAYCYLCNFEDDYICHRAYGRCELINKCRKIF